MPLPALKVTHTGAVPESGRRRRAPVVFVGDVAALIDDGELEPAEYDALEKSIVLQVRGRPCGLGCVVVVPAGTKPPSEAQRAAINGVLSRVAPHLNGLVWVVEARGFEGATVRGILLGLSLFGKRPYPTHVSASVVDALGWLATRHATTTIDVERAAQEIAEARAGYERGR